MLIFFSTDSCFMSDNYQKIQVSYNATLLDNRANIRHDFNGFMFYVG